MYKSIEQIQKVHAEKQNILQSVYQSNSLDDVYQRQRTLGVMSIGIFSDAANAVLPALSEDGVSNVVWPYISLRLNRLSFISVPTKSEILEKYRQSITNPTVIKINGTQPEPGTKTNVKKISVPAFISVLAAQGIAVPLLLSFVGGTKWALVKIIPCAINAALMVIEVVKYINYSPSQRKETVTAPSRNTASPSSLDYDTMCKRAIHEVYCDNRKKLDEWFDILEKITAEEIDKALKKTGV